MSSDAELSRETNDLWFGDPTFETNEEQDARDRDEEDEDPSYDRTAGYPLPGGDS